MKRLMIGAAVCLAVAVGGVLAYRHFVTHQITDKGGMENPFLVEFPQDAALQSLDWTRNAMNYDDCFSFSLRQEGEGYEASCDFAGEGERLRRENAPLTAEDWASVEQCLKNSPHTPKPEDGEDGVIVADETTDRLTVVWKTAEGETERAECAGGDEDDLWSLLRDILARTPDEYAPPEQE